TDTERHLAHGEGLADTAALAPDDDALEDLDTFLGALDDLHMHIQGVARTEIGDIAAQRALVDEIKGVHDHPSDGRANRGTWRRGRSTGSCSEYGMRRAECDQGNPCIVPDQGSLPETGPDAARRSRASSSV